MICLHRRQKTHAGVLVLCAEEGCPAGIPTEEIDVDGMAMRRLWLGPTSDEMFRCWGEVRDGKVVPAESLTFPRVQHVGGVQ